jgi:dTDP-4-amino-4,6-dideoxygalactose transaminase
MIPRQGLDIGWSDLLFALQACLRSTNPDMVRRRLEATWSPGHESVACLSVRSGFDALLAKVDWPPGSEVLVSAATIRDMPGLISEHGFVPVPVDVDFRTLTIEPASLAGAITPRTRGILAAHLFGSRMSMSPIRDIARQHHLLVIEDCAQAFAADGYRGDPDSDVTLFSFGPIKTATALGGGILRFRDHELGRRVREHLRQWPEQSNRQFVSRVAKYCLLVLLSARPIFSFWTNILRLLRIDYDALISRSVRGFGGSGFLGKIRRQPSAALLALLERRLQTYSQQRIDQRQKRARQALELLPYVSIPGRGNPSHTFWVFPILCDQPEELRQHLIACGFDATRGASSMCVAEPRDASHPPAHQTARDLSRLLYLPVYPGLAVADLERLAEAIAGFGAELVEQETPQAQEESLSGQQSKKEAAA